MTYIEPTYNGLVMQMFVIRFKTILCVILLTSVTAGLFFFLHGKSAEEDFYCIASGSENTEKTYIKWVDFNVPYDILNQALGYDIGSYQQEIKLNWIELLAYTAAKNYGHFPNKKSSDMDNLVKRLQAGENIEDITDGLEYYSYYLEAYSAVLSGFVGEYTIEVPDSENPAQKTVETKYGLKVFSPIAKGYYFSHYSDFGDSRSYGYKRVHLGNDLLGSVGTPVIAIEGGLIEAMGWNQYGGWRVGIRSYDQKRYYYYAHLRKDHPFNTNLKEGDVVKAGDVIGYLGMTGYSTKENVNNIKTPHLHVGLQLIFDESQKDGTNQIWIDIYNIINLLQKNKCEVVKDQETNEYVRKYDIDLYE